RYMRFGKGADCAAVAMLVNEALRVTLPSQIPCLCKLTWPIKPDSDPDSEVRHTLRPETWVPEKYNLFTGIQTGIKGYREMPAQAVASHTNNQTVISSTYILTINTHS